MKVQVFEFFSLDVESVRVPPLSIVYRWERREMYGCKREGSGAPFGVNGIGWK
jgi:hypothetical protein